MAGAMFAFRELLRLLSEARLEFVVIGGVAATLHGATEPTRDLDVCIALTPESWRAVHAVIAPLHPRQAHSPDRRPLTETPESLATFKNLYVLTDLGRLDFLGEVPPLGSLSTLPYETMQIDGLSIRVLSLDALIRVKESIGRPKDLEVVAELKAIRDRQQRT
jgi:hypothetical protein